MRTPVAGTLSPGSIASRLVMNKRSFSNWVGSVCQAWASFVCLGYSELCPAQAAPASGAVAEPRELQVPLLRVTCLAFSPDGKTLAIGGGGGWPNAPNDGKVVIIDVATGRQRATLLHPGAMRRKTQYGEISGDMPNMIQGLAFSPDGRTLATAAMLGAKLWDVTAGSEVATLGETPLRGRLTGSPLAFSPDGKLLTVSIASIELWDVPQRKLVRRIGDTEGGGVAISPDGRILATAEGYNRVHLWGIANGRQLAEDHAYMGPLYTAAFTPDGKTLAAGGEGGVKLWDVKVTPAGATLRLRAVLHGTSAPVRRLAISPDGRILVTVGEAFLPLGNPVLVKLWEVATGQELLALPQGITCVAFSPDGQTVAIGVEGGMRTVLGTGPGKTPGIGAVGRPNSLVQLCQLAELLDPQTLTAQAKQDVAAFMEAVRKHEPQQALALLPTWGAAAEIAVPQLIDILKDASVDRRVFALQLLGMMGARAKSALPTIMEKAFQDESPEVQQAAHDAMGPILTQIDPEALRRGDIAEALRRAATKAQLRPPQPEPSRAIRRGEQWFYEGRPLEEWIDLLGGRPGLPYALRDKPTEAIRVIGPAAVPLLIKSLDDKSHLTRPVGAIKGLGLFGNEAKPAIPALIEFLRRDSLGVDFHGGGENCCRLARADL